MTIGLATLVTAQITILYLLVTRTERRPRRAGIIYKTGRRYSREKVPEFARCPYLDR
ncbi:MAG: hypothetical protein KC777_12065 [Cyanobacteria bacterium HKST-UBA02]|nr:hypothetical protein [Cyanobacteria bacterium HKST-UBA02]